MKTRLLPGIDLARIAVQPEDLQLKALRAFRIGRPQYSYDPMRRMILDILHVSAGPLASHSETPWERVAERIIRAGRHDDERRANLQAAKALRAFADSSEAKGRRQEFFPLALGLTTKLEYWSPAVVSISGVPTVLFIDPRRSKRLTAEARRFVLSVMHQRIREADPDYEAVSLSIIQFDGDSDERSAIAYSAADSVLYSFEELNEMVQATYALWRMVLKEREAETRKKGSGTGGLFEAA